MPADRESQFEKNAERRELLVIRACNVMGWQYKKSPVWAGLRKVATGEAVAISLDKFEEILEVLEARDAS